MFGQGSIVAGLAVLSLSFVFSDTFGQNSGNAQDPQGRSRNVKHEPDNVLRDWADKDVSPIITKGEADAYKKLKTNEERERFIEIFWQRRNPDPDSEGNTYREEYYERMAYANEHYASGIPGWKTDRGRMYLKWGKPDEIESHPSGGSYDRPYYEGGGTTSTYPFETWFYRHIEGVGSGIEIEFVDPTGSGEYRIARSPEDKNALAHVPGAGLGLAGQLDLQGPGGIGSQRYVRAQDNPFERLEIGGGLEQAPQVKFSGPGDAIALVDRPNVDENPLNFDVQVSFFRRSDESVIAAFMVQTENNQLTFRDNGGLQQAHINIFGKITPVSAGRSRTFEDPVITSATTEELVNARERRSVYQRLVALQAGHYKVDVIVRDINSGAAGVRTVGFEVPRYNSGALAASTLVLAARLENAIDQPPSGQFVIGNVKVIPNLAAVYRRGQPLGLYMQVYNAGIDQTTLRPSVDVEYVLLTRDGKEIARQAEDWRGMSEASQRLTLARLISTTDLVPGQYSIAVRIRDRVSGQELSPSARFTVIQ
jgi:GWxTD domain-containing protein